MVLFPRNPVRALHHIKSPRTLVRQGRFRQPNEGLKRCSSGQPSRMVCPFEGQRQLGNKLLKIAFGLNCKNFSGLHDGLH